MDLERIGTREKELSPRNSFYISAVVSSLKDQNDRKRVKSLSWRQDCRKMEANYSARLKTGPDTRIARRSKI